MAINLSTFWAGWDVVSGNTSATNQYEFWKGMVMSNGQILNNQYDFFTYHNTTRYEWFKNLQETYPEVYDEYTFYKNTNNPNIYDMRTFYEFGAQYLVPSVTPTPTPTNTVTPTVTPTNTVTPTPTFTPTPSSTPTGDADAQAYLAAVVATGGTVTSDITVAVETLFEDLKSAGIYSKLDVLMPMVGGTKDSCLINAITPTNDLYKWTEYGTTLTYNVSGITGNRNGVLQSNFVMTDLTNVDVTNSHFTMYLSKLNTNAGDGYLNGYLNTQELPYTAFNCATYGDNIYGGLIGDKNDGGSMPAETGMWLRNRESNTGYTQYISNVLKESVSFTATESSFEPSMNIALFTLYWRVFGSNNLYNGEIGDMTYSTVTIGGGLNSSERTDLNNIITTFNTTLGRP
jgi:hypothetical protein